MDNPFLPALRQKAKTLLAVAGDLDKLLARDVDLAPVEAAEALLELDRLAHQAEDLADRIGATAPGPIVVADASTVTAAAPQPSAGVQREPKPGRPESRSRSRQRHSNGKGHRREQPTTR
jgi:hypothetical protein